MNSVIVQMWRMVQISAAKVIIDSFEKTNILPLKPPSEREFVEKACISSLWCGTGKKATELKIMKDKRYNVKDLKQEETNDKTHVIISSSDSNRNLIIRHVVHQIINKTLVLPAQEILDKQQEISDAKKIKVDDAREVNTTRLNPDTSRGLFVVGEVISQAKKVRDNRRKFNKEKKQKKLESAV